MGVRPRRGGRAGGLILTLILVGGYYFAFVTGDHMAAQGRLTPFAGVWAGNILALLLGIVMLARWPRPTVSARVFRNLPATPFPSMVSAVAIWC